MKPVVLITGASAGIGCEMSRLFAGRGNDLVLVARNAPKLEALANELETERKITARVFPKDLSLPGAASELTAALREAGIAVSILVNNAGFGVQGPFHSQERKAVLALMQVNMTALVELTHEWLPQMIENGAGRILNVASTAAFEPGPVHGFVLRVESLRLLVLVCLGGGT